MFEKVIFVDGMWYFLGAGGIAVMAVTVDKLLDTVSPLYKNAKPWRRDRIARAFNEALKKHDPD